MSTLNYAVSLRRVDELTIEAVNRAGSRVLVAPPGRRGSFSPVELLLAALGGCAAIDIETLLAAEGRAPGRLELEVRGQRPIDQPWMDTATVRYSIAMPDGAAEAVERAVAAVGDELCTVALTLREGCDVTHEIAGVEAPRDGPAGRNVATD